MDSTQQPISLIGGDDAAVTDNGAAPLVTPIEAQTLANRNYRTTLWTGKNLQCTLMTIPVGGDIGLEVHPDNDQFLRIEAGTAKVELGPDKDHLTAFTAKADDAVFVPAGTWHNLTTVGDEPLKLYSIYAPSHHPFNTVHKTKEDAMNDPAEQDD
ncbi:MAG: cupin domain-containing protein [Candidatus Nomurabacteria bacterium]|jgi:mannose-6-phosphate isomerase-like protein (cupin superfamily)|nr:cupin domain-containing protein [Candidatus Nomurabacteria bacterium]